MKLTRRQTTTITRERAINFAKRDFVYKQEKVINQTEYTLCWCDRYNNGHIKKCFDQYNPGVRICFESFYLSKIDESFV